MRWPNYTPCQTFDKGNQDHKVVYSLKILHLNKEQFYACVFPGFYKYVSHSFDQSNFAQCYILDVWAWLQILGGRQCASDFARGGLWPWRWRKNCGPGRKTWWDLCCLLMRLGLRGGVHTVQEVLEGHGTSFPSFTKSHLPSVNNTLLIATL